MVGLEVDALVPSLFWSNDGNFFEEICERKLLGCGGLANHPGGTVGFLIEIQMPLE